MSSPRTLDALRSAVARVLVARGESTDALALAVGAYTFGGSTSPLHCANGTPRHDVNPWA